MKLSMVAILVVYVMACWWIHDSAKRYCDAIPGKAYTAAGCISVESRTVLQRLHKAGF